MRSYTATLSIFTAAGEITCPFTPQRQQTSQTPIGHGPYSCAPLCTPPLHKGNAISRIECRTAAQFQTPTTRPTLPQDTSTANYQEQQEPQDLSTFVICPPTVLVASDMKPSPTHLHTHLHTAICAGTTTPAAMAAVQALYNRTATAALGTINSSYCTLLCIAAITAACMQQPR